jgi:hypothetical protein
MANWREQIDPTIAKHLEAMVKEVAKDREAVLQAKDPKIAQLWIAIANLQKQNFDLHIKAKTLEAALKDSLGAKKTKKRSKKEQAEIDKIIKSLGKF